MWTWKVTEGELWHDGSLIGRGYSGTPECKNNPEKEALRHKGPIPRGKWKLGSTISVTDKLGPIVIRLEPDGHTAFGRSGFLIHGDSKKSPGTASTGCIILPYAVRVFVAMAKDRELEVV